MHTKHIIPVETCHQMVLLGKIIKDYKQLLKFAKRARGNILCLQMITILFCGKNI